MFAIRATYIPRNDMHFDRDYYVKNHIVWQASIDIAFLEQDKPTIEAQQAMIALHDATDIDDGLRPVVLGSDAGPVRCRHVLKKLRDSDGVELPDPRNPALSELVENSRGSYNVRVTPIV